MPPCCFSAVVFDIPTYRAYQKRFYPVNETGDYVNVMTWIMKNRIHYSGTLLYWIFGACIIVYHYYKSARVK